MEFCHKTGNVFRDVVSDHREEYGIVVVVAKGVGTCRIQDGQTISVDGSAGTVALK